MKAIITIEDHGNGNLNINTQLLGTNDEIRRGVFNTPAHQLSDYLEQAIRTWKTENGLAGIEIPVYPTCTH